MGSRTGTQPCLPKQEHTFPLGAAQSWPLAPVRPCVPGTAVFPGAHERSVTPWASLGSFSGFSLLVTPPTPAAWVCVLAIACSVAWGSCRRPAHRQAVWGEAVLCCMGPWFLLAPALDPVPSSAASQRRWPACLHSVLPHAECLSLPLLVPASICGAQRPALGALLRNVCCHSLFCV